MKTSLFVSVIAAAAVAGLPAGADTDPDNAIKFRKSVMQTVGGTAGSIAAILQEEVTAPGALGSLTAAMQAGSDPAITIAAFRTDTTGKGLEKTTAKPEIWTDWAKFEEGLRDMNTQISIAAAKGDSVSMDDMKAVFKTCKSCHDDFREK